MRQKLAITYWRFQVVCCCCPEGQSYWFDYYRNDLPPLIGHVNVCIKSNQSNCDYTECWMSKKRNRNTIFLAQLFAATTVIWLILKLCGKRAVCRWCVSNTCSTIPFFFLFIYMSYVGFYMSITHAIWFVFMAL